jgi:hypothetical protein
MKMRTSVARAPVFPFFLISLVPLIFSTSGCALFNFDLPTQTDSETKVAATAAPEPSPPAAPAVPAPTVASELKKKILILPFLDHTPEENETLSKTLMTQIQIALAALPDVIPVPLTDLPDAVLVPELGAYPMERVLATARREGIAGVVLGSIEEVDEKDDNAGPETGIFRSEQYDTQVRIKVEVYDVASEKQIFTKTEVGKVSEERAQILEGTSGDVQRRERAQQAAQRAIRSVAAMIPTPIQRISWSGRIAKIDLHRYYITGGRSTGLLPGQLLRVIAGTEPIYDAQTGKLLGMAPGRLKGLLKVVDNFGPDASIAVLHSGAGFHEQDRVEPYMPPQEP